jgi:hypothetical protein
VTYRFELAQKNSNALDFAQGRIPEPNPFPRLRQKTNHGIIAVSIP